MIDAAALSLARTDRGLSQRKLAQLVGLHFQVIRRLENGGDDGNLTLRDFEKICRTLELAPITLLKDPDRPVSTPFSANPDIADELDLSQARLLRRIQRGGDTRKTLSTDERELVLPRLLRNGLVTTARGGTLTLSSTTTDDLADPERL